MKIVELTGVITKDSKAEEYCSLCIEVNIASQGRTISEARKMLTEAVALYLETCVEEGTNYLRPVSPDDNPLISSSSKIKDTFKILVKIGAKTSVKTTGCKTG